MRPKGKLLISAIACAVTLAAVAAGSARADTITPISQLSSFHQMVVDTSAFAGSGYVFISGGGSIVVTDLTGTYVTTLDAGDGVEGIALSSDGSTLYAALNQGPDAGMIAAISVSTITPIAAPTQTTYSVGTGDFLYGLALQGGKLWVSYLVQSPATGLIGDIDLATGTFEPHTAPGTWPAVTPDLAADPRNNGVLVAVDDLAPSMAETFSITNGTATTLAPQANLGTLASPLCSSETQVAVVPGGQQFIAACHSPQNVNEFATKDLSVAATFNTGAAVPAVLPDSAAIDTDGTVAVGTFGQSAIYVYKADGTLLNAINLRASSYVDGVAWEDAASGTHLAALEQVIGFSTTYSLEVFDQPTVTRSALTLTPPSKAALGQPVTLTGSLTLSNGAALPSGTTVTITRTGPGGTVTLPPVAPGSNGSFTATDNAVTVAGTYTYTATYTGDPQITTSATSSPATVTVNVNTTLLTMGGSSSVYIGKPVTIMGTLAYGVGSVPAGTTLTVTRTASGTASKVFTVATAAGGTFTLTDTPTAAGTYAYTASYAGNSTTAAATASRQVSVIRLPATLTVTTGATTFTYEPTVPVTAHLGTTYRNRVVSIYAQWLGSSTRTLLKTGQVDSRGNLAVSYRAPHSTTFTVVFAGDAHYAPRTITRTVGVRARVTQSISGYYGTTTIGGTVYHLFHSTGTVKDLASVAPGKQGQCVKVEVQEFFQGAWHANVSTGCIALSSASQVLVSLGLRQADHGVPYRQRADYIRSSSDVSNLSNDSSWFYALVET